MAAKTPAKKTAKKTASKKPYKKSDEPSRADKEALSIENDVIEFWKAIGTSELNDWDKPWIYNLFAAENAGKFLNESERYIYKGGFNQFLIASSTKHMAESPLANLIINRTEMSKLFDITDFKDSPVVKNGIKSVASIYNRPVEKILYSVWNYPSGARWSGAEGEARPTAAQVEALQLTRKDVKGLMYPTFPVWSIHDIYEHLPEAAKTKVNELVELRKSLGYPFNPEDEIEQYIDREISDLIERQGIKVVVTPEDRACYRPLLDEIQLPTKEQFKNPIARLAVTYHEMTHSTKHVLGRRATSRKGTSDYAIEEVVAETSAVMMVKALEKNLADVLPQRPDIAAMFDDYYKNAMTYNHGWGEKFDFAKGIDSIVADRENEKGVIKSILVNIAKAVDMLTNQEFTPEQRLEAKKDNFKRWAPTTNTPEPSM